MPHVVGIPDRITARPKKKRRVGERAGLRPDEITNLLRLSVDKPGMSISDMARAVNMSNHSVTRVMMGTGSMAYLRSDPYWVTMVGQALDRVNVVLRSRMVKAGITANMPLPAPTTHARSNGDDTYHAEGDGVVLVPADHDERLAVRAAPTPPESLQEWSDLLAGQETESEEVPVPVEPEVVEPIHAEWEGSQQFVEVRQPDGEPVLVDLMRASVMSMINALGGPEALGLRPVDPAATALREGFKRDIEAVREMLADIERRVDLLGQ